MSNFDRLVFSFFNVEVMARYLPSIIDGFFLTVRLAVVIILTGLSAGLLLALVRAFRIRPLNWIIIFLVDLFRALGGGWQRG